MTQVPPSLKGNFSAFILTGKRARELFAALDDDGNGFLDEEEFVQVFRLYVTPD